jgi:hypothetical protein
MASLRRDRTCPACHWYGFVRRRRHSVLLGVSAAARRARDARAGRRLVRAPPASLAQVRRSPPPAPALPPATAADRRMGRARARLPGPRRRRRHHAAPARPPRRRRGGSRPAPPLSAAGRAACSPSAPASAAASPPCERSASASRGHQPGEGGDHIASIARASGVVWPSSRDERCRPGAWVTSPLSTGAHHVDGEEVAARPGGDRPRRRTWRG